MTDRKSASPTPSGKGSPFEDLENRLNMDEKLRTDFLKDPTGVLKREGVELTPAMVKAIKTQFKVIQTPKLKSLGMGVHVGFDHNGHIGIKIYVSRS